MPHWLFVQQQRAEKQKFSLPVKTRGDSYSFDIADAEYNNQIALTLTNDKMKELNSKNITVVKKVILFLITISMSNKARTIP
jgi:hypothetical protein